MSITSQHNINFPIDKLNKEDKEKVENIDCIWIIPNTEVIGAAKLKELKNNKLYVDIHIYNYKTKEMTNEEIITEVRKFLSKIINRKIRNEKIRTEEDKVAINDLTWEERDLMIEAI